jgi:hypothetical protein
MPDRRMPRCLFATRPVHIKFSIRIWIRLMPFRKRLVKAARRLVVRRFTLRIPMTVVPVLCIRAITHEHQCAQDNNCHICFHDDVILMPRLDFVTGDTVKRLHVPHPAASSAERATQLATDVEINFPRLAATCAIVPQVNYRYKLSYKLIYVRMYCRCAMKRSAPWSAAMWRGSFQ